MAFPSYVNSGALAGALGAGGGTPALPGSLVTDNLLIAWIQGTSGTGTVNIDAGTIANGWTLGGKLEGAASNSAWAWRLVDGAEAAPTFVFSVAQAVGHWQCDQFTGNETVAPIGAHSESGGTGTTVTGGTIVTTNDKALILGHLLATGAAGAAPSTPTNYTSISSFYDGFGASRTVSENVATSGTTTDACDGTISSAGWTAHVIEISSGGTPIPPTPGAQVSQLVALVPYSVGATSERASELLALVTYAPSDSRYARVSQMALLVPYSAHGTPEEIARMSQFAALVTWGGDIATEGRSRAWGFVMDGHPMYVLDLGDEGTFIFDLVTKQWSKFKTGGHIGWNMKNGTVWQETNRILGGDANYPYVWEMKPDELLDEGFRPIEHAVTGGIPTRSRVHIGVSALRLTGSPGDIMGDTGVTMTMKFSDDNGKTWSADYTLDLTANDYSQEMAWRSLGSFMAPGRIFEISDVGGIIRIDGADVFLDSFDDERLEQNAKGGGGGDQQG